jgi:serine phosphatase RsbU (regulator of sigma subunit)
VEDADTLTVILADVSGHGLPTGIVMASAKASASALARTGASGTRLFELLDGEVRRTTDARTFVTLAHVRFRRREGVVEYTNAGHLYPYRAEPDGTVTALANPTRPLGLNLPVTFRTVTAQLREGDLWVVLSDGIVEATAAGGDEQFGFARLERILAEGRGTSAAALRDRILSAWRAFTGTDEPTDDRTLLVLKAVAPPGEAAPAASTASA